MDKFNSAPGFTSTGERTPVGGVNPPLTGNQGPVPTLGHGQVVPPVPHGSGHGSHGGGGVLTAAQAKARDLASDASNLVGQAKERARQWAGSAADSAGEYWDATGREARHLASRASSAAETAWDAAGTFIRRHPVPTLVSAVAFGFLMGCFRCSVGRRS